MGNSDSGPAEIDRLCDDFEQALRAEPETRLEEFLLLAPATHRQQAFHELLKVELELRSQRGDLPTQAEYLARFDQHTQAVENAFFSIDRRLADTALHGPFVVSRGLHVRCPHCHNPIELVPDAELESISCPSCGSDFSLVTDADSTKAASPITQVGEFRLIERVGLGAFGAVWKARDTRLDRTVAVKIPRRGHFDADQERDFLKEAQNAAQLSHPNIVPVYAVGRDGDTLYIVSEFIRGVTLADWLTAARPTLREAVELCDTVAGALEHAHEKGVVHRDLKPGNIMLDDNLTPHLMDFGLAKRDAGEIAMSVTGQILGTPAYMSPEQAEGNAKNADRRSDVYSLGVILFQLLTGELPFRGSTSMLLHQVIHDEPPRPRRLNANIPRDLETITLKCLEKEPRNRYATAHELREEFNRYLRGVPIRARPISPGARSWRWCKRNPVGAALVISIAMIAVVASSAYLLTNQARKEAEQLARENATLADRNEKVVEVFVDAFRATNPTQAGVTHEMTAREVLERAQKRLRNKQPSDDPLATAALLHSIGAALLGLGDYELAKDILTETCKIRQQELGLGHADTLSSSSDLARVYMNSNDYEKARSLLESTIEKMEAVLGSRHRDTIENKALLAYCLRGEGKLSESIGLFESILAVARDALGKEDPTTLLTMSYLADSYANAARLPEAIDLLEFAHPRFEKQLGVDHLTTLNAALSLEEFYQVTGRVDESLQLSQATYDQLKAKLGPGHPSVLNSLTQLATAYQRRGDLDRAIPLLEEALALCKSHLGVENRDTVYAMGLLAFAYQEAERLEEALPLFDESLRLARTSWGPEHLYTLISVAHLVQAYEEAGMAREEMPVTDEEYERARGHMGFGR